MDGLQYLPGYVPHVMVKKIHKCGDKSNDVKEILQILNAARSRDPPSNRLVKCLSIGGLWEVKSEQVQICIEVDEEFRRETSISKTNINILFIIGKSLKNIAFVSSCNIALDNTPHSLDNEKCPCLLEKLIALYLRVRSLSLAKDKTNEINNKKSRGLHNELKKSTN